MVGYETRLDQALSAVKIAIDHFGVTPHMVSPGEARTLLVMPP